MKKIILLLAILSLASCSISVNDEGVKIDGDEMWKIEAGENWVVVDGGELWIIEAWNSWVLIESSELWKIKYEMIE